jgi:hypothetical protein
MRVASEQGEGENAAEQGAAAVSSLESVRADLRRCDGEDAMLEEQERELIYLDYARVLEALGRRSEALALLESAEWPPLLRRFAGE